MTSSGAPDRGQRTGPEVIAAMRKGSDAVNMDSTPPVASRVLGRNPSKSAKLKVPQTKIPDGGFGPLKPVCAFSTQENWQ